MMKRVLFGLGATLALSLVAAGPVAAKTKTHTKTTTTTLTNSVDNYNGFQAWSGAEHGGYIDTKTKGNAVGVGIGVNAATANSSALGGGAVISGNLGPIGAGLAGSAHVGAANTAALSGSAALAGSAGNGSSRVETGGYSAAGAGVRNEWGTSVTNGVSVQTSRTKTN